jgi:hypothetical protein
MSAGFARGVNKVIPFNKAIDPLGNALIKQDNAMKQASSSIQAQTVADADTSGTQVTQNAATRDSELKYAADSAGAIRNGNEADTLSGSSVMTPKKKAAARDLGAA